MIVGRQILALASCFAALACAGNDRQEVLVTSEENVDRLVRREATLQARAAKKNLECCARHESGDPACEIKRVPPVYPKDALRRGVQGLVKVRYSVGEDGRVDTAEVIQASPPRVFEQAALRSVYGWQFCPGENRVGREALLPFRLGRP